MNELPKQNDGKNWKLVWWQGGDMVEGHNYPKAPLRNSVADIAMQCQLYFGMCRPYVTQKDEHGHMIINPLIEKMMINRGNHEMNSTKKEQAFSASDMIHAHYGGLLESQFGGDLDAVREMMPYSQFNIVEREGNKEELYNLMAAYTNVCGYPILGVHFFETGSPNGNDFIAPMEHWINRAGVMAKEYAMLMQWHYHTFGLGTHAGKTLFSWPAPTGMSDYEYGKGLSTKYQQALVHLSNKHMPVIEILTNRFFQEYQFKNDLFQRKEPLQYQQDVVDRITKAVPLMGGI
jgi:hypothetical protein